jgi:hypothetical protein
VKSPRRALLLLATVAAVLSLCGTASANDFMIGGTDLSPREWTPRACEAPGCAFLNVKSAADGVLGSTAWEPARSSGEIVRLNVAGATTPGVFRVRTMSLPSPYDAGVFAAASAPIYIDPTPGVHTYEMSMPINAGEFVGISMSAGTSIGFLEERPPGFPAPGQVLGWNTDPPDSGTLPFTGTRPGMVGFNVEVQPPPQIAWLANGFGTTAGGTSVTIAGDNFEGTTAVSFGGVPAAGFTVEGESRITAISPAAAGPGGAPISITTPAGTTTGPSQFVYLSPPPVIQCTVPKLAGMRMKAVRLLLSDRHCRIGSIKRLHGATDKLGRVVGQSPPPVGIYAAGEKVSVILKSPRPAHAKKKRR